MAAMSVQMEQETEEVKVNGMKRGSFREQECRLRGGG